MARKKVNLALTPLLQHRLFDLLGQKSVWKQVYNHCGEQPHSSTQLICPELTEICVEAGAEALGGRKPQSFPEVICPERQRSVQKQVLKHFEE